MKEIIPYLKRLKGNNEKKNIVAVFFTNGLIADAIITILSIVIPNILAYKGKTSSQLEIIATTDVHNVAKATPITAYFLVRCLRYINEAVPIKTADKIKFDNSPIKNVDVGLISSLIMIFIAAVKTPKKGPKRNPEIKTGRSEISNFTNAGAKGRLISINISSAAIAPSIDRITSVFVFIFLFSIIILSMVKKISHILGDEKVYMTPSFSIRTITVGTGITPVHAYARGLYHRSGISPAPKIYFKDIFILLFLENL